MNFLFATGAAAAVAAQKESGRDTWSIAVVVCGLGAPLCLASGVFVWWLAAFVALVVRLHWGWIAGYTLAGALTIAVYMQGYARPVIHNGPVEALRRPLDVVRYLGHYLGSSWRWSPLWLGEILAAVGVGLLGFRLISLRRANPWEAVPVAVMFFSLGTGLLAALGRLNFGIGQAGASRYQTPALLFWFMGALLGIEFFGGRWMRVAALVVMVGSFAGASNWLEGVERERRAMDLAGAAWLSGVADDEVLKPMRAGNQLELYWPMRERRLGPFATLEERLTPERIAGACTGGFQTERTFVNTPWPGFA